MLSYASLLIANRGEIACRVARTARRLGLRTIAVYSDADAGARHVADCDEAIAIGGRTPAESYLRIEAIIEAAQRSGAQAVHPGYGFLSENADFAERCRQAGLVFVGPPPAAIRAMGSKSAAKSLLERAGVPLTPGYHGEDQGLATLQQAAAQVGYPVLIKASAGGGGRGMRRVDAPGDFAAALASCQREAAASFGDDRVLVEKYLLRPRHIEIQVFADSHGHCLHLNERDCSVQRRHQKVLEEAPAPGMTPARRAAMGAAAVAAARAVGYVGAGTVEFIVAADGQFYFMEMNTRLQVEHPVTEMITGIDLVEWQLRVAAGEALPLRQDQVGIAGHAIEARIYAEDPARDFLPSIGTLQYLATPAASRHVRVDAGVVQGDAITPYYDPMIAKLIAWDESRELALARLGGALEAFRIVGVANNVEFLRRLVAAPAFAAGDLDTALIERESAWLLAPPTPPPRDAWLSAAVTLLLQAQPSPDRSPWSARDGWRLGARAEREVWLSAGGQSRVIAVQYQDAGWILRLDDQLARVTASLRGDPNDGSELTATIDGRRRGATVVTRGMHVHVFLDGRHDVLAHVDPLAPIAAAAAGPEGLRAPMPGRIIELIGAPGAELAKGAPLLVLEAMKIEHTVLAPSDGILRGFRVAVGEQVAEGSELVDFEPRPSL
ncbi:MAG TPA: acetyl/propionyl/methylcrotonyl-CoA carboxylase subunit alpha [Steroidobacteraceae bacterium]|nr:acetyl/propionyl/methylcrotonyl-CoA carboxylase subunit alpha [Steroidobacteraceae bacterium]